MTEGYASFLRAKKSEEDGPTALLVLNDFEVPVLVETDSFKLVPLGPDAVEQDYEAYVFNSSLAGHITRSTDWPREDIDHEVAMAENACRAGTL